LGKLIGKPLDNEKIAEIKRLAETYNYSNPKIAEIIGVHKATVGKRRRRLGLAAYKTPQKISDEEIIFLKKIGFSTSAIAEIKRISLATVSVRVRKLKIDGYLEPSSRGWGVSWAKGQRKKAEALKKLIDFLNQKGGVILLSKAWSFISPQVLRHLVSENKDKFQILHIKFGSRQSTTFFTSRLIKKNCHKKKFIAFRDKDNRAGMVRLFMKVLNKGKYNRLEVAKITQWLKSFGLTRAERTAIIIHLGYRYSTLEGMKIDGYLDRKRRTLKIKSPNI